MKVSPTLAFMLHGVLSICCIATGDTVWVAYSGINDLHESQHMAWLLSLLSNRTPDFMDHPSYVVLHLSPILQARCRARPMAVMCRPEFASCRRSHVPR